MGLEDDALAFLAAARSAGVSFATSATLGRQAVIFPRASLLAAYATAGCSPSSPPARVQYGWVDGVLRDFGATELVSIDASRYEGASRVHDMNEELPDDLVDRFSFVLDAGTLEHIFDFPTAIRNCMRMVQEGGHLMIVTPTNNEAGHGLYQFSPELFYRVLTPAYGFQVEQMLIRDKGPRRTHWYEVSDPDVVGSRAQYRSRSVTYLYIRARRIGPVPVFSPPPQQSDYAAHWQQRGQPPAERTSVASVVRRVGRRAPWLKRIYRSWRPGTRGLYKRYDYRHLGSHFRRIDSPEASATRRSAVVGAEGRRPPDAPDA